MNSIWVIDFKSSYTTYGHGESYEHVNEMVHTETGFFLTKEECELYIKRMQDDFKYVKFYPLELTHRFNRPIKFRKTYK
jgi:hypothetical protein